jgi:hypothetical protein
MLPRYGRDVSLKVCSYREIPQGEPFFSIDSQVISEDIFLGENICAKFVIKVFLTRQKLRCLDLAVV